MRFDVSGCGMEEVTEMVARLERRGLLAGLSRSGDRLVLEAVPEKMRAERLEFGIARLNYG